MKKFYTLALGALIALTTSAAPVVTLRTDASVKKSVFSKKAASTSIVINDELKEALNSSSIVKAPAKLAAADMAGDYTFTLGDYYFQDSAGEIEQEGTVEVEGSNVTFSSDYFLCPVIGTANSTFTSVTIKEMKLGQLTLTNGTKVYCKVSSFKYVEENGKGSVTPTEIDATFDGQKFSFPVDCGFGWGAYEDAAYTKLLGYLDIFDVVEMAKIIDDPNADPNEGWTSLGNAQFKDPWLLPGIGMEDSAPYEVELQQNDADENVYRLVDPYKGNCPAANFNTSTAKHGYIQFNVSDPDHVYFIPVEAGFANADLGVTKFYCNNQLGGLVYEGYEASLVVEVLGDMLPYATLKDGVINLGSVEGTDEEGNATVTYDAIFGIQGKINAGYGWTDENDIQIPMLGKIVFPGAGAGLVEADEADAPVKYYNLQGVEVAAPAAGQFVIRVQGDKATKMVVR